MLQTKCKEVIKKAKDYKRSRKRIAQVSLHPSTIRSSRVLDKVPRDCYRARAFRVYEAEQRQLTQPKSLSLEGEKVKIYISSNESQPQFFQEPPPVGQR